MRIMLNGRAGAGKDEIAKYLVENHNFIQLSFATPIYELAKRFFKMTNKDRKLLQDIGQSWRQINPDVWVDYLFGNLPDENVVISDVRQTNEYVKGINSGFIPIRVDATLENRVNRITLRDGKIPDVSLLDNEAENGADDFTYIQIYNDGTFDDLYSQIDNIVGRIKSDDPTIKLLYTPIQSLDIR
jgi:cytidylate kinase